MLKKIIRIPGFDEPVTNLLPVIETPLFQRLREIKQHDLVYKVYPAAQRTRFEHSIGVLHNLRDIVRNISIDEECHKLSSSEIATLEVAALLHDIGQPPFSHAIEFVLMGYGEPNHDKKALEYLEILKPEIEKIPNVDFNLLVEMFKQKNPMIWGLIGADTLEFVNRDAESCGIAISADSERIKTYAFFDGKTYGVDTKAIKSINQHLDSMNLMSFAVYNNKAVTLLKSFMRRGIYEMVEETGINVKNIWPMTDAELFSSMALCNGLSREIYKRIRYRTLPKAFLTIKIAGEERQEEIRRKSINIFNMPQDDLMRLVEYFSNIKNVMKFEKDIENELCLSAGSIVLAEMPHIKILQARDVPLFDRERGWTSLFTLLPECQKRFDMNIKENYALRVGVTPELRKEAYEKSNVVLEVLKSLV